MSPSLLALLVAAAPTDGGPSRTPDAGALDGGAPARPADAAEVERLRARLVDLAAHTEDVVAPLKKRLGELEARTVELEKQLRQVEALQKKVDRTADDLATLKREVNDREEQRKEAERKAAEQKSRTEAVTRALVVADQQLASGASSASVGETLRAAEASYTGAALEYVRSARAALANNDLGSARKFIGLAVLETQFMSR
jgi:chromosome segregation ATPase